MARFTIPAPPKDPFHLSTRVDGGTVQERGRALGTDADGRPRVTIDLDDSTQVVMTLIRRDLLEVDAGTRVDGEGCRYAEPPFHLELWKPALRPLPTAAKDHTLPGVTSVPPKKG